MTHPMLKQFDKLLIVKKIKEIILDWWKIQVHVTEKENSQNNFLSIPIVLKKETIGYVCSQDTEQISRLSEGDLRHLTDLLKVLTEEIIFYLSDLERSQAEIDVLKTQLGEKHSYGHIVGRSHLMKRVFDLVERVKDSDALILIRGENGTGKELIAEALHFNSKRKELPFLVVNCGAFNENLLESELFGHMKGSFTGATQDKKGLFEAADKGTLFLDEIGDTSLPMQVKLLRVLQEGTFRPVGSNESRNTHARIVCATNKNIEKMVQEGLFREDLFYRLNVININLPSLKERKEDLPYLIDFFLEKYAQKTGFTPKKIDASCLKPLMDHSWPGNIRELENEMERLCVLSGERNLLSAEDFSDRLRGPMIPSVSPVSGNRSLKEILDEIEFAVVKEGLLRTKNNKSKLAQELGISRANLIAKVAKYRL